MPINGYGLFVGSNVSVVSYTHSIMEIHVTSQGTKVVHLAVDTEVVTVEICVAFNIPDLMLLLVE